MKGDLFIRTLLIIIVTLLALNIILPILSNPPTSYAAKNIEYKVIRISELPPCENEPPGYTKESAGQIEKIFSEYGKEGWEYIGQITIWGTGFLLIFKR